MVSVIGKRPERLQSLVRGARDLGGSIYPIAIDYHDTVRLKKVLSKSVSQYGSIDLAVVWIHRTAPEAPYLVAELAGNKEKPCRYIHVLGSSVLDPSQPESDRLIRFQQYPNIKYQEVILGFVLRNDHARWLTNQEISHGVIQAIESQQTRSIVGVVSPWSKRPR
ncbi:short-chain dehydrogenase [Thermoflavimicrobium dichotomicum]|uniref:Short chain dehydrogenase n=1 Tax=Thermoflavimicrobium dichotomicum TaxID=46223 RepID=A0A1I3MYJ4_9BACL|nr:short-chain dehydrogenase [Thermoflavimicrobium dichotomicum]SFJ01860.1 hypothetical protein SAMN05421852_103249 [Thermoflavimicrobium dichotomicum]